MYWYEKNVKRLLLEKAALQKFETFTFVKINENTVALKGTVRPNRQLYNLLVVFPESYPHTAPTVYLQDIEIEEDVPHVLQDSTGRTQLSLHYNDWQTAYTCVVVIGWAVHWLHCYEHWKNTQHWPAEGVFIRKLGEMNQCTF